MNHEEALGALDLEVARLRGQTHMQLAAYIDKPQHAEHIAASGRWYQVEIGAAWDDQPGQVLRLFFSVDDGGLRSYFPLTRCGLIPPGGCFDGEAE